MIRALWDLIVTGAIVALFFGVVGYLVSESQKEDK